MIITDYSNNELLDPLHNKVYPVVLSKVQFEKKPSAFRRLHDELDNTETSYISLIELLEAVTKGQTFKNGAHIKQVSRNEIEYIDNWKKSHPEITETEFKEKINEYQRTIKPVLKETNLAVLDVDDVLGQVSPIEVMKVSGAIALYYTFSHETNSPINTKMFRYRLLFDLSESVKGKKALEAVQQEIKNNILAKFPHLHQQTIQGTSSKGKSHGIDNITKMFYGSNRNYEINEAYKTVEVADIINAFEKEHDFSQLVNKIERLGTVRTSTTDAEILDIARFLGDMNDTLNYEQWIALSIGLWNTAQIEKIDDEVILEALQILDGNRQSNQDYLNLKQPLISRDNQSTIGTLIKLATDRGYKRTHQQQPADRAEQAPQIATRTHNIKQYINKADIYSLLENEDERILVQSATNTGKTRASIEASKDYLQQHKQAFIYVALPTQALSQQVVEDYNLNTAILGNLNVQNHVDGAIYNNTRLLVGTYDKAEIVCSLLTNYDVIVIADEVHKEVTDYNYRYKAIQSLFNLKVTKFIGLTGTPSEIDLTSYDCLEVFQLDQPKVLADKLQFIDYYKANDYEKTTAQIIELEVKNNNQKVLAFVNRKVIIDKLARALRKQGLKVATITAENRKSKTYRHILEKQRFDDDIDVVLTTIVLADGININNTKDYVCVVAPSHHRGAHFFNIDLIKQATNRFRNQYSKIILPFYVKNELIEVDDSKPRTSNQLYDLENQYHYLLEKAQIMKAYLQTEFNNKLDEFTPSIAEGLAGLFRPKEANGFNFTRAYQNQQLAKQGLNYDLELQNELERLESKIWDIDTRTIRQQASEDKERYYSLHPHAFRKAVKQALNVLEVKQIEADDYLVEMRATLEITKVIDELNKLGLETERAKRDNVQKILHELIYAKVKSHYLQHGRVDESLDEWKLLKNKMSSLHYNALTKLIRFMEYEEIMQELQYIDNTTKTYELTRNFEAIHELEQYNQTTAKTITENIFNSIKNNVVGRSYSSKKALDEHLEELAKDFKIKGRYTIAKRQRLFKQVFNKYVTTASSKSVRVDGKVRRLTDYKQIDFNDIATKRDLTVQNVKELYSKYLYLK